LIRRAAVAVAAAALLSGCIGTVVDVVTLPVRVVGAGINAVVPSQKEHDRKRGKRERKAEEAERKAAKKAAEDRDRSARAAR
jgi:hypothetical protein